MNCPFCDPKPWEIFHESPLVLGLWNAYPVTPGHALLVTRRHVPDWFAASPEEISELAAAVAIARQAIQARHRPDGFNVGANIGEAGGQTVFHLHLHVLPRYFGQRPAPNPETDCLVPGEYHRRLRVGTFLKELAEHLKSARSLDMLTGMQQSELAPIQAELASLRERGGLVRARIGKVPCEYFRVCDAEGQETVWLGGPDWHYSLLAGQDRDGQRELRKAFEEFWATGSG